MYDSIQLSVILPSYLEEENLRVLLPRLKRVLSTSGWTHEILIIDTFQALDHTAEACSENAVRYVNRAPANSFGDAVRTGIKEANGQWLLFMDADGSHTPEFIPSMLVHAEQADIVIASRYVSGGHTENSLPLVLMSKILNISYALILNLKCKDVSNSFKLYRANLMEPLDLQCENFDIVEEILFRICRDNPGTRIVEVPFTFKKRMFGDTKRNLVVFILTYLITICRLRWGLNKRT